MFLWSTAINIALLRSKNRNACATTQLEMLCGGLNATPWRG